MKYPHSCVNPRHYDILIAFCASVLVVSAAGCGGTAELASPWSAAPVSIDGSAAEWSGSLTPLKDAPGMIVLGRTTGFYRASTTYDDKRAVLWALEAIFERKTSCEGKVGPVIRPGRRHERGFERL